MSRPTRYAALAGCAAPESAELSFVDSNRPCWWLPQAARGASCDIGCGNRTSDQEAGFLQRRDMRIAPHQVRSVQCAICAVV